MNLYACPLCQTQTLEVDGAYHCECGCVWVRSPATPAVMRIVEMPEKDEVEE